MLFKMLAQSEYAAKQTQQATEQNENTKHTPDVRTKVSTYTKHYYSTLQDAFKRL
jgi:hypothetical protein